MIATTTALTLADYVGAEAGFGADLGTRTGGDPGLKGAPSGYVLPIREARVSGGAGRSGRPKAGAGSGALLPRHGPHGPPAGRVGFPSLMDLLDY